MDDVNEGRIKNDNNMNLRHVIVMICRLLDLFFLFIICRGTDLPSKPVSSSVTDKSANVTVMHMTTLFSYSYIDTKSDLRLGSSDGDTIGLETQMMITALHTFAAVFGSMLLVIFLFICIYFYRTRPANIPEILPTDELWPDSDLIQNIHDLYFSSQSPYFVNPAYFDERTDSHLKKKNDDGETACRNHLSTPTLSNKCCSGKGNRSRPLAGSPKQNESYSYNECALSYRKTECYVNDLYGDGSDV